MDHEQALEEFEQAWRAAQPLDLRQVVARFDSETTEPRTRRQLVHELVMIDFWHRWRRSVVAVTGTAGAADTTVKAGGNSSTASRPWPPFPRLEDYVQRYPDLLDATDFPIELIAEEYRARRRFGDQPTHREFFQRFPQQSSALAPLLAKIDSQLTRDPGGRTLPPGDRPRNDALPASAAAPQVIGKYVVLAPLDRGGQGRVFRAMHPELRQVLAIKLGHPRVGSDQAQQDALVAEARLLAQLDHPNLVRVRDLGFHENCPYIVLDYVPGRSLREVVREQPLSPERAAEIVAKVARALAAVHARGITHGDLKPANILIDENGEPRLIDFGIARERSAWSTGDESSEIAGTLLYMAPEQARGESTRIGCRTDVYGLGAVLYELLVGQPPRGVTAIEDLIQSACRGDAQLAALDDPKIPQLLAASCRQALSPSLEERQSSVLMLAEQIEHWHSRQQPAKPRRLVAALASMAVIASLAVGAALLANSTGPRPSSTANHAEAAAALVGRLPRHDFPLSLEVVGHPAADGVVRLRAGENIALNVHSEVDCYVGVWHIDGAGTATQLFPNDAEQDHFLAAKSSLTIPGRDSYSIQVRPDQSPEYLWLAATTCSWDAAAGRQLGPGVVLAPPGQTDRDGARAASIVARTGARLSECVLQMEVRTAVELAANSR